MIASDTFAGIVICTFEGQHYDNALQKLPNLPARQGARPGSSKPLDVSCSLYA